MERSVIRDSAAATCCFPDFAPLHPGYASWNIVRWVEPLACAGRHGCEFPIQLSYSERMCVRILAARCARALRRLPPSIRRGRRESRVRAAPAVSCANMHKKRTRAYRFSGGIPAFPAQWFTAYSALSPVTGLSCHRHPREVLLPANLTPASGCQDHTVLPYAYRRSSARCRSLTSRLRLALRSHRAPGAAASTASHRAFVTIASRPSHRVRRAKLNQ